MLCPFGRAIRRGRLGCKPIPVSEKSLLASRAKHLEMMLWFVDPQFARRFAPTILPLHFWGKRARVEYRGRTLTVIPCNRQSVRLKGYDYSQAGAYFVTIVTHGRECLLGKICDGNLIPTPIGNLVESIWQSLPMHFPVVLDQWVVMPNHLHGIIIFPADCGKGVRDEGQSTHRSISIFPKGVKAGSLSAVVQNFKSTTTYKVHAGLGRPGLVVWQRSFYEYII